MLAVDNQNDDIINDSKKIEVENAPASKISNQNIMLNNKPNKILICLVCVLVIIIIFLVFALTKKDSNGKNYYNDATIQKYISYLGKEITTDSDGNATLNESTEFIEGLNNIELCGISGTGTHGINKNIISEFKWMSNSESNTSMYNSFIDDMNKYIGSTGEIADYDGFSEKTNVWVDRVNNYMILAWEDNNKICVCWFYEEDYLSNLDDEQSHKTTSNIDVIPAFTNKFGTRTTKCAHSGCTNYIATTGDTNCCTIHSKRCLECNANIDEDAVWCMSCLEKASEQASKKSGHYCEECGKEAAYAIDGITGKKEYYCSKHYKEMQDFLDKMTEESDKGKGITDSGKYYGN